MIGIDKAPAWTARAACRDSDIRMFFPEQGESAAHARAVCRSCPVRLECLDDAIERQELFGIWGGLDSRERSTIRRVRAYPRRMGER